MTTVRIVTREEIRGRLLAKGQTAEQVEALFVGFDAAKALSAMPDTSALTIMAERGRRPRKAKRKVAGAEACLRTLIAATAGLSIDRDYWEETLGLLNLADRYRIKETPGGYVIVPAPAS